jgi:8-oxo-dGTP pyrophosphatase MutT (NUDIX family)
MGQKYKVFINTKLITLTSSPPKSKDAIVLPLATTSFQTILHALKRAPIQEIFLIDSDPSILLDMFKTKLPLVQAAGGLVQNNKGKMLFIFRKGKWDLPKGKVDKGETLENGALREVEEETGVNKLQLTRFAGVTYHVFKRNSEYQLKETYWFHMTTNFSDPLKPEIREGITKVAWKGPKKVAKALENSYGNIKYLLENLNIA